MRTLKFISLVLLFTLNSVNAQYGNNGYGSTGYGGNRMNQQSIQNTNNFGRNEKTADQIEKERVENLNKVMEKLTVDLKLDDLQVIVIKKEIEDNSKNLTKVSKSEVPDEQKIKEMEAINEKTDRTINTFLNDDQKIKYKKMIEERNERMEKIKNRR
ncbi:hypothetical protein OX283_004480 [Flavobacterium sp. SUN052]|jgi:hypothetical protein|uniref:hypothetical protein n=1 Tax=Flavobacterium sp. SUN052 TaxID=3002441 RepID=UPI00237D67AD|nr:hypothetical protein [Flavobacterium sp. SUN052]MEC4003901.1 hypothetical protein [Flavobacterium sp. SUN052]